MPMPSISAGSMAATAQARACSCTTWNASSLRAGFSRLESSSSCSHSSHPVSSRGQDNRGGHYRPGQRPPAGLVGPGYRGHAALQQRQFQ